jgi:nucleotide-binding universal stress UspA family protein
MRGIEMYERLLVPLDGSELAEVAIPYAEELAGKFGSKVILLNVRRPSEDPSNPEHGAYLNKMIAMIEDDTKKSPALSSGEKAKVESAIIGLSGLLTHPAEEILDYAEKENISLIVMATHGRTGIKRWALGSVAEKVVRASTKPILLVRANINGRNKISLRNILVPLDGSKQSESLLPNIKNLASELKSKVILLHVILQPYHIYAGAEGVVEVRYTREELKMKRVDAKNYLERLGRLFIGKGIIFSTQVRVGEAAEEIIKFAEKPNINLVAMSTHGRSGFSRWEHGSIADKVLHAGNTPLLLTRP